jgi:hypothetical protein
VLAAGRAAFVTAGGDGDGVVVDPEQAARARPAASGDAPRRR